MPDDAPPSLRPPAPAPDPADPLDAVVARRWSRREVLRLAGAGAAASWVWACGGGGRGAEAGSPLRTKSPDHHVADGYAAQVVVRWGDPVTPGAPAFTPAALTADAQARQFGFNNDFLAFLPLPKGSASSDHGLLCVNHEYTTRADMLPPADLSRPAAELVALEQAAHGHSVLEVARVGGTWKVVAASPWARRIDARTTRLRVAGPAAGHPRLRTTADPTGTEVVGTLNDCSGGVTPWGTVLLGEENVDGYFAGTLADDAERDNHRRMGIPAKGARPWAAADPRFDLGREPHEPNRFGWVVEVDPYDAASVPVKRTALGRFKHEAATTVLAPDGRVVVYSGDDEAMQCVYRYVSRGRYDPLDPASAEDLLDDGTLSVGRFDDDGTLHWLPLVHGAGPLTSAAGFASQADVLIEARRAAALLGATPMDRPEDVEANPATGRVYVALTKNKDRTQTDAANPRAPNPYGHVLELIPPPDAQGRPDPTADAYTWEVFLRAGNPARPTDGAAYGAAATADGWLACPDNVAFDPRGRLWIATDGADDYGVPDGVYVTDVAGPGRAAPRMVYACPVGAELCGPCFTPDGTTLFVSVQHPGEGSPYGAPSTRWPDFTPNMPPRPSVVAIRRTDGSQV